MLIGTRAVSIISIVILMGTRVVSIISKGALAGFPISIYRGLRLLLGISYLISLIICE